MTCVVGIIDKENNKIYIGSDTICSDGNLKWDRKDSKIFKKGPFIFGFTGSYRMGQVIKYHSKIDNLWSIFEPESDDKEHEFLVTMYIPHLRSILMEHGVLSKDEDGTDSSHTFLIGFNNRLFSIESDFQVAESADNYNSIGSGVEIALGSLYTSTMMSDVSIRDRIQIAIEAAMTFVPTVGGEIDIISTD